MSENIPLANYVMTSYILTVAQGHRPATQETEMARYSVAPRHGWNAKEGATIAYMLQCYPTAGTSVVIESNNQWASREEAEAAAARANAGDESGLNFSSYADD